MACGGRWLVMCRVMRVVMRRMGLRCVNIILCGCSRAGAVRIWSGIGDHTGILGVTRVGILRVVGGVMLLDVRHDEHEQKKKPEKKRNERYFSEMDDAEEAALTWT